MMEATSVKRRWLRFTLLGMIKTIAGISAAVGAFTYGLRIDHRSETIEFAIVMIASTYLGIWSIWSFLKADSPPPHS